MLRFSGLFLYLCSMRHTQRFLNWFLGLQLAEDGIQGNKTNAAIKDAIVKLKNKFAKEKLIWDSDFNFIGIRTSNDFTDLFTDWFVSFAFDTIIAVPASTKSGLIGVAEGQNNWHGGINGVLVIAPNQTIDYLLVNQNDPNETFVNKRWSGRSFLFQDKDFYYYRDNNGDRIIDYNKKYFGGAWTIGGNVHTWKGYEWDALSNLTKGCQVCKESDFDHIESLWLKFHKNKRIKYHLLQW
jgi:hypothetical protein